MSCDKYSDLWPPFIASFERYWPECSVPIYLSTETKNHDGHFFSKIINSGANSNWTERLRLALNEISSDYIIMLCDDYLLCDYVDGDKINSLVDKARFYNAGNLRLLPNPRGSQIFEQDIDLRFFSGNAPYRISTQVGIWQKEYLKKLSKLDTSIWGFERLGSVKSATYSEQILCTHRSVFPFLDSVHKGKWESVAISMCERNNISIDLKYRPPMSNIDYIKKHVKGFILDIAPILTNRVMNLGSITKRFMVRTRNFGVR
jgi:hypothetical protein